jgi:hypothetical protein
LDVWRSPKPSVKGPKDQLGDILSFQPKSFDWRERDAEPTGNALGRRTAQMAESITGQLGAKSVKSLAASVGLTADVIWAKATAALAAPLPSAS